MKKIMLSLLTIGIVGVLAFGASRAFFSDVEESHGNIFTAGAIDLKIDSECSYNGEASVECGSWVLKDLEPESDKFFNFTDIKPGDWGENTISLHVINNDAWACITVNNLANDDNDLTEPESLVDTTGGPDEGELAEHLYFTAWADDGDNVWEEGEPLLFSNKMGTASDVLDGRTYALADSTTGTGPILGGELTETDKTYYFGISWCFGAMDVDEGTHTIACDGSGEGNITQTDSLSADVSFQVVQARNNPNFVCEIEENLLVLENKDENYNRLLNDGRYGELRWAGHGPTFDYSLEAFNLAADTEYSLLYYADGWPGNNPGYYFGSATTDGSGYLVMSDNPDLNMDLPDSADANYSTGAKIWLIPSGAYESGSNSVTIWPFDEYWLFESNLITYDDTNSP